MRGSRRGKASGVYKGRKPSLTPARADELRARLAVGENKSSLARKFKVSRDTLYAYIWTVDGPRGAESKAVTKVGLVVLDRDRAP